MAKDKIDLKKKLAQYYTPKTFPEIISIPTMQYLMIDGEGAIGSQVFQDAIQSLFSISYKVKFTSKKNFNFDYVVMPLEGLWWADNMNDFENNNKEKWKWTLMILQPDEITADMMQSAITEFTKKVKTSIVNGLKFEKYSEGNSVQIMHVGPFSTERSSIVKMHQFIEKNNGMFDGKIQKHHEIYLSDFRKVNPQKMKTVLRQPFVNKNK